MKKYLSKIRKYSIYSVSEESFRVCDFADLNESEPFFLLFFFAKIYKLCELCAHTIRYADRIFQTFSRLNFQSNVSILLKFCAESVSFYMK